MNLLLALENLRRTQRPMTDTRKIYVALRKAGSAGLTGVQLGKMVPRYSTRISDLRREGHNIIHIQDGRTHRFVLRE